VTVTRSLQRDGEFCLFFQNIAFRGALRACLLRALYRLQ
jgi:hypothetical protein